MMNNNLNYYYYINLHNMYYALWYIIKLICATACVGECQIYKWRFI